MATTTTIKKETPESIGAASATGGTINGTFVFKDTAPRVYLQNSDTNADVVFTNSNTGDQGIYSYGYYNGTSTVDSRKWMIVRDTTGKVTVADHYNKDEVDAKIGTFTAPDGATLTFDMASGTITDNTAKSNVNTMFTNLPIGFSVRFGSFGHSGTFLMLISKVSANYGFVKCISYIDTEYTWIKNGADSWTCKKATLTTV